MATVRSLPLLVALALLSGCDQVDQPYELGGPGNGGPVDQVVRKVLLEDMTGHTCNNCPDGARKAAELQDLFGEDLIVVGVHCTETFAAPLLPLGDDYFDTDFRTESGNAYEPAFGIFFLPTGMVSRVDNFGTNTIAYDEWGTVISSIIGTPSPYHLWFDTLISTGNTVSTTVKLALLETVTGDLNMTIYLTEDSVVDWQVDNDATPPEVPDYVHRHVLRANLNGTWGVPVVTGSGQAGDTISLEYSDFALDPAWNPNHCALVAYVYDTTSDEVMQAEERKFQP